MAFQSLHDRLRGPIPDALQKDLNISNRYALPRISHVTVSVGINKQKMDTKEMHQYVSECLATICGQKPVFRVARKAISNFKIREGNVVGAMVTLRGNQMEAFLDKLLHVAIPRIRDFRGLKSKLDGQGNYNIGIREHSIFPEIQMPDASKIFGLQVTIATTAEDDESAMALLKQLGVPFMKKSDATQ